MYGLPAAFVMLISFATVFWLAYKYLSLTSPKKIFSILFAILFVIIFLYVNVKVRDSRIISTCVLWFPMVFIFFILLVFLISKGKHPRWFVTLLCGKKYSDTIAKFVYGLNKKKAIKNICIISAVIIYSVVSFSIMGGFSGTEQDRIITSAEDIFYDSFYGEVLTGDPNFKMLTPDKNCVETDGYGKYMVTLRAQASGTFDGGRLANPKEKLIYVFLQKSGSHVDDFGSDSVVLDEESLQSYKEKIGWVFDEESPNTDIQQDETTVDKSTSTSATNIEPESAVTQQIVDAPEKTESIESGNTELYNAESSDELTISSEEQSPNNRLVTDGVYSLRGHIGTWGDGRYCLLLTVPFTFDETADGSRSVIETVFFYPAGSEVDSYEGLDIPSFADTGSEYVVTGRLANENGEYYFLGIGIVTSEEMSGVVDNDNAVCPYCGGAANYTGGALICTECGKIY